MTAKSFSFTSFRKEKLRSRTASRSQRLAGLPVSVIERAKDVLRGSKDTSSRFSPTRRRAVSATAAAAKAASQVSLFAMTNENAIDELRSVDVDDLSPEESKAFLHRDQTKDHLKIVIT